MSAIAGLVNTAGSPEAPWVMVPAGIVQLLTGLHDLRFLPCYWTLLDRAREAGRLGLNGGKSERLIWTPFVVGWVLVQALAVRIYLRRWIRPLIPPREAPGSRFPRAGRHALRRL